MKLEEFKDLVKSVLDEQSTTASTGPFAIPSKSYLKQNKKDKLKEAIRAMVKQKVDEGEYDIKALDAATQEKKKKEILTKDPQAVFKTKE
jgi:hypothetical protein